MKLPIRQIAIAATIALTLPAAAQSCTGDIVANGIVNGADLGVLLSYWGPRTSDPFSVASDINGDGIINGGDLGLVLSNWGPCPALISGITPTEGCFVGGTTITITGSYLGTATAVMLGGVPATNVTVNSPTTVTATTPAGILGPATVLVTTAAGTYTAPQPFTYMPASVSSIVPNQGLATGGTLVTISGAYLGLTTSITIGGSPCTNVTVVNATTVTAVTPVGTVGNADVVITGGKGPITVPSGFQYFAASVPSWATLFESEPDPTVVTDPWLRAAISATGLPWRVRDRGTGIEMLLVPPGTFQMGCVMGSNSNPCMDTELPVHLVTLTEAFYLGRFEVTQAQWTERMGSNPSSFQAHADSFSRPVDSVSWTTIQGYLSVTGLRLPTEAEWEFACRAGTETPFYNGSTEDGALQALAWVWGNSGYQTHAVGGKVSNHFGLHDMLGNVWEYVNDCLDTYPSTAQTDPAGPGSGSPTCLHVVRGGSWASNVRGRWPPVRSSLREGRLPQHQSGELGFRVARNP